jgi:hypothetical protein
MSVLLFRIGHHVPDDELHEVRQLLTDHGIDFYETTAGLWQVGLAGIWLHDPEQEHQARALLATYQQQRLQQAREQQAEREASGKAADFLDLAKTRPLRLLGVLLGLVLILLVSLIPVFWLLP